MTALRRAAAVAAAATALLAAAFLAYPFQASVLARELALRAGGARRVRAGALLAWERDLCAPREPCRCVAFIHGMGDSALTWDKVLLGRGAKRPPRGTRLLALDLPGTEGSPPADGPDGYSVPAQAETVRDALAPRCAGWTVAGNSLGGWIAADLALRWPAGVKRLVLANPAGLSDELQLQLETARVLADPDPERLKDFMSRAYARPRAIPSRALTAAAGSIKARPAAAVLAALRREHLLDRRAKGILAPTIVVWGAADRVMPAALGERYARLIPGAELRLVPDCGHLPQQECPAAVAAALW